MKRTFFLIPLLLLPVSASLAVEGEGTGSAPVVQPSNEENRPQTLTDWLEHLACHVLPCEEAEEEGEAETAQPKE